MAADRQTEQLPLSHGVQEIYGLLAERPDLQAKLQYLASLTRDDFQSKDFVRAGYHTNPDAYGAADRSLWQIGFTDQTKVFLLTGKIASNNPYEMGHAATHGLDLRKPVITIIEWDGKETLVAEGPTGKEIHTGELAKPETFLRFARSTLGTPVAEIEFV